MADKKNPIILKITQADGTTKDAVVEGEQVIIGSGPSAGVKLTDPKVSSLHFMLKVDKNGVVNALDLGSETGTVLGGKKIIEPTALASGDTLQVGETKIRVAYGEAERTDVVSAPMKEETKPEAKEEKKAEEKVEAKPEEKKSEAKAEEKQGGKKSKKEKKAEKAEQSAKQSARAIGTVGATAMLFNEQLPAEETPSDSSKTLEVAQLWGDTLINIDQFGDKAEVTAGSERKNDFHVFHEAIGASALIARADGANLLVTVPDGSDVVMRNDRSQKTREQLKAEGLLAQSDGAVKGQVLKLGLHDRAMVTVGTVAFIVRWVRPQKLIAKPATEALDFYFTKVLSVTFMAFIVMWWAIKFTDLGMSSLSDDLFKNANKYAKMLIVPPAEQKKIKKLLSGVQEGAKAKKEEGKFGKKEAKKEDADPSKKGAPKLDPNKREEDRMKVAKSGLLAAFGKLNDGAASNVLGPGGLGTGINNAIGGLKGGAGQGDAHGVGGLGSRGTGPGGGGNGLGLGGLGTKGGGRGAGGYGSLDLGGKGKDTVRVIPGKTTVVGSLSREEIERVIKRHQNEILFCYNTELQKDPNLGGKVAVNFTIDPAGGVSDANAAQNTTNNNNMEQCMLARIRRWKFPEPKGGGVVVVTYPWIFNAAGGGEE